MSVGLPPQAGELGEPQRIGDHETIALLGAGGQGRVYLARSPGGTLVAVKVLSTRREATLRRFERELQAARRIPAKVGVPVIGWDMKAEPAYIVSEYVRGPSLARWVCEDGVLAGDALMRLALRLAEAVQEIHRVHLIHRDIKPANVMMAPDGLRVIDFGIVHAFNPVTSLDLTVEENPHVMGTLPYMAPEQIAGGNLSPAIDVHAWAATTVYAATGRPPYGGDEAGSNLAALIDRIRSGRPYVGDVADPLRSLLLTCLCKDPGNRLTAASLVRMLRQDMQG